MELVAAGRGEPEAARLRPSTPVLPSLPVYLFGALGWGVLMAAGAFLSLKLQGRAENFQLARILMIYFAGGLAAWPIALPLARALTRRRPFETRFAAHFALLSLGTIAVTAFFFALDYRLFYAQWHHPPGTRIWLYQLVFTIAGAGYQFLVMGLSLYLPVGLPVVAGASLWLSRSIR
ncbi:MAG TPA: hypothetical protein VLG73_01880 [Shinella sp.]|nr:hypothetical protein [Shinella sp.]